MLSIFMVVILSWFPGNLQYYLTRTILAMLNSNILITQIEEETWEGRLSNLGDKHSKFSTLVFCQKLLSSSSMMDCFNLNRYWQPDSGFSIMHTESHPLPRYHHFKMDNHCHLLRSSREELCWATSDSLQVVFFTTGFYTITPPTTPSQQVVHAKSEYIHTATTGLYFFQCLQIYLIDPLSSPIRC